VQGASKRVKFSSITSAGRGLWLVGGALTRRFNRAARRLAGLEPPVVKKALNDAAQGAPANDNAGQPAATVTETKSGNEPAAPCGPV